MTIAIDALDELSVHAAEAVNRYLTYCQPDDAAAHVHANLGTIRALADASITDATGTVPGRPRVHNVTLLRDGGVRVTFDSFGVTARTVSYMPTAAPAHVVTSTSDHHSGTNAANGQTEKLGMSAAPATSITKNAGRARRDHKATFARRNAKAVAVGYPSYRARRVARSTGVGLLAVDAS